MALSKKAPKKPAITIKALDRDRLRRLAENHFESLPEVADELLAELERAQVVPDRELRPGVVAMHSTLRYTTDLGEDRTVTLVFPGEADIASAKISILTPIGVALLGLRAGQSIPWTARDGKVHRLTVEHVETEHQHRT